MEVMLSSPKMTFPTMIMLWLLLWLQGSPISIPCSLHERNHLLNFKAAVVDEYKSLDSWQGFNCCDWDGVRCSFLTGHVARLDLREYHLGGIMHPSLFQLTQLEHLDLSRNSFLSIRIPSDVGKLKSITFLDLSYASASADGSISLQYLSNLTRLEYLSLGGALISSTKEWGEAVGRLHSLRELNMCSCGLTGPIPISLVNLTSLLHLHLADNSLSAQIPAWFENVTSHLLSLDLSVNQLFGSIPAYLFRSAHQLQVLDLSQNNNLTGHVSVIGQQTSSSLTSIALSVTGVEGQIPSAIGNMSSLERLLLCSTNIEGQIPLSIVNLSKLVELDLSENKLTGVIPPSFGSLSSLVSLDLSENRLNGIIPSTFSELVKLKHIWLRANSLSGLISLSLFHNMMGLQQLFLGSNRLTVRVNSTWIPHFKKLLSLGLYSCNLAGIPSFLVNQYYLKHLILSANSITGNIPSWIWNLPNLSLLAFANNQLTGSLPSTLTPKSLQFVILRNNSLQGTLPVPPLDIQVLDLSANQFNAYISSDFCTYGKNAQILYLSDNNLSGGIPKSLCNQNMEVLDLSNNMLSNKIPPNLTADCPNLIVLNLAANRLEGDIFREWGKLKRLHALNLNGNQFVGAIPSSIAECSSLQVFDLGNNNLEGNIPEWIGHLSQLQMLVLRWNKFQGNIPPEIFSLRNLQILDLSHNKLSGCIPSSLASMHAMINSSQTDPNYLRQYISPKKKVFMNLTTRSMKDLFRLYQFLLYEHQIKLSMKGRYLLFDKILRILKCIDLSDNNLSGGIPPEMGSLQGLITLNLSRNHLSGQIPKTLGAMLQLESLDLSVNKLEGKIPGDLQLLNYLQFLNLSFNMLHGKVPLGGQFLTFGEASYLGNANLSGIPFTANATCNTSFCHDGQADVRNNSVEAENSDGDMQWWVVGVGLSYGLGFSIVIGVLTFNNRVRITVFRLYDSIIFRYV